MSDLSRNQLDQNYEAFTKLLPELVKSHPGKFALMHDGNIMEYFDTVRDAYKTGNALFKKDTEFSIQEIIETPIDLGFFSHAVS